jgi:hypothetical protein
MLAMAIALAIGIPAGIISRSGRGTAWMPRRTRSRWGSDAELLARHPPDPLFFAQSAGCRRPAT